MKHAPVARAVHRDHSLQLQRPTFPDWLRSIWEGLMHDPWDWVIAESRSIKVLVDDSIGPAKKPGTNATNSMADAAKLLARRIVMFANLTWII